MKDNLHVTTAALIKWITLAVVFLTPLLFSPWTFDFYEFPKQVFLWIAATILLVLWLLRFVLGNEVKIIKTPIDVPLILFIVVGLVSMLLSSSRYTSLVGFFGRPDNGFASIIAYSIIFYVASSTMNSVKDVLHVLSALVASCVLLAVLAVLYFFGLNILHWQTIQNANTFSPAGGMYALTMLLTMAVPISLGLLLYWNKQEAPVMSADDSTQPEKASTPSTPIMAATFVITAFISFAVITLFGNLAAWVGLLIGISLFFLWSKRGQVKASMPFILAVVIVSVLWLAVAGIPQVRKNVPGLNQKIDQPQVLSAKESWFISGNSMRDLPFFGSGPATYLYDFTRYHSATYNLQDTWTLRYLVAHDQYLQVLTTLGVLGLIAYLFLVGRILVFGFKTVLRNRDVDNYALKVGVFAAICAYIGATFFIVPTSAVTAIFFLLLATLMVLEKISGSQAVGDRKLAFILATPGQTTYTTSPNNIVPMLLFIPGVLVAAAVFFLTAKYVQANVDYVKGVKALSSNSQTAAKDAIDYQTRAVLTNPWEDGYHRDLARTEFNVALAVSQKQNLTDADKNTIRQLLSSSISQAQRAASLAPMDANNWQTMADIYRNIATQVQGAGDAALQAYGAAMQVDQNPQLYVDVGGLYFAANAYDRAIDYFRQAVSFKPNYANAYYNLANAYVKKGDYNSANAAYQYALTITQSLPDSDPGKKTSLDLLRKEMAAIADKVSTQSATPATGQANPQSSATVAPSPTASAKVSPAASPKTTQASPTATPAGI